ncbi:MAG: NAD(P)-binding domain-containing protein [Chloroflexota bacterium]
MNIGFVGLGIMGSRMAGNLLNSGHAVTITNRSAEKGAPLVEAGATWVESVAEVARRSDILFSMLAHPDAVAAVGHEIVSNCSSQRLGGSRLFSHCRPLSASLNG